MAGNNLRKRMTIRQNEIITGFIFVGPALIYMMLMIGYPVVYNLILSFQDISAYNLAAGMERPFVGFENYKTVIGQETMSYAVRNTFFYTLFYYFVEYAFE